MFISVYHNTYIFILHLVTHSAKPIPTCYNISGTAYGENPRNETINDPVMNAGDEMFNVKFLFVIILTCVSLFCCIAIVFIYNRLKRDQEQRQTEVGLSYNHPQTHSDISDITQFDHDSGGIPPELVNLNSKSNSSAIKLPKNRGSLNIPKFEDENETENEEECKYDNDNGYDLKMRSSPEMKHEVDINKNGDIGIDIKLEIIQEINVNNNGSVSTSGTSSSEEGFINKYDVDGSEDGEDLVKMWIRNELEMPQYSEIFIKNGYKSIKSIKNISNKSELKRMGIMDEYHQIQILTQIRILNTAKLL